jgi:hypothetical protein
MASSSWTMVVYEPRWFIEVNTTVVHTSGMTRADPQMKIRMPPDLHERIAAEAKASGRSMNSEIVHRLNLSFGEITVTDEGGTTHEPIATLEYVKLTNTILESQSEQIKRLVDAVSRLDPSYIEREREKAERWADDRLASEAAQDARTLRAKRKGD